MLTCLLQEPLDLLYYALDEPQFIKDRRKKLAIDEFNIESNQQKESESSLLDTIENVKKSIPVKKIRHADATDPNLIEDYFDVIDLQDAELQRLIEQDNSSLKPHFQADSITLKAKPIIKVLPRLLDP